MPDSSSDLTALRKVQHVKIVLEKNVQHTTPTGFDDVHFLHYALPELNYSDIDTTVSFLKRKFALPFMVLSMTGGHETVEKINKEIGKSSKPHKTTSAHVISLRLAPRRPFLQKMKPTQKGYTEAPITFPM